MVASTSRRVCGCVAERFTFHIHSSTGGFHQTLMDTRAPYKASHHTHARAPSPPLPTHSRRPTQTLTDTGIRRIHSTIPTAGPTPEYSLDHTHSTYRRRASTSFGSTPASVRFDAWRSRAICRLVSERCCCAEEIAAWRLRAPPPTVGRPQPRAPSRPGARCRTRPPRGGCGCT